MQPDQRGVVTDACYLVLVETADDIVSRLEAVTNQLRTKQDEVTQLAAERRALVLRLHDEHGWTDARIAAAINVSRAAVQLIRAGK